MANSEERLLFPAWSGAAPRRTVAKRRQLLLRLFFVGFFVLAIVFFVSLMTRKGGTDRVLGSALNVRDADSLGLSVHPVAVRAGAKGLHNPWRGAGNRMREDLLSSVSGCGGKYRPWLRHGDTASLFYSVREADGAVIDGSGGSHAIDVVLGSGQVNPEMDRRLKGLCAGETVTYESANRFFIAYVERVGRLELEDERSQRLEVLAHVLKSVRAPKGVACELACRRKGMRCAEDGFRIINACPRLREAFACRSCETAAAGSSGPDMPCYVELSAPLGHPRGSCMVNPKVETATCKARYAHTRRLCPCVMKISNHQE